MGYKVLSSGTYYQISKKDYNQFNLILYHAAGEPEAFICCVIQGEA